MRAETAVTTAARGGFEHAREVPLWSALFGRRTRRVSRGVSVDSGPLRFTAPHPPQSLSALEEAMLVASIGVSGFALQDKPDRAKDGEPLTGAMQLHATALTAPSADSAHSTHFFMWNDAGTYLIRHLDEAEAPADVGALGPEELVAYSERLKVKISDARLEFPHRFPAEMRRNRFASNVPGSTIFCPVVELTEQYINGLLFLFSQDDGMRPVLRDDFNLYRRCGLDAFVRSGYLNDDLPLPLSQVGRPLLEYEALFLLQNLALAAEALGLGGWLHWAPPTLVLLGGTDLSRGLGFRFVEPKLPDHPLRGLKRLRRKLMPFPVAFPNPVGLDGLIESFCPPYYKDMDAAVDAVLAPTSGAGGMYRDVRFFDRTMKQSVVSKFLDAAPHHAEEAVECVRTVCRYIYGTYGRFPAHMNAVHSQSVWFQVHHIESDYYDTFFDSAYPETVESHQRLWHGEA